MQASNWNTSSCQWATQFGNNSARLIHIKHFSLYRAFGFTLIYLYSVIFCVLLCFVFPPHQVHKSVPVINYLHLHLSLTTIWGLCIYFTNCTSTFNSFINFHFTSMCSCLRSVKPWSNGTPYFLLCFQELSVYTAFMVSEIRELQSLEPFFNVSRN